MNRSSLLILAGILCLCATTLIAQKQHLNNLQKSILSSRNKLASLERKSTSSHSNISTQNHKKEDFTSAESLIEPRQKIQKATQDLEAFITQNAQKTQRGTHILPLLKDILAIIRDLNTQELIQLGEELSQLKTDEKNEDLPDFVQSLIRLIASEDHPLHFLNTENELTNEETLSLFTSLVRKNPSQARQWLDDTLKNTPDNIGLKPQSIRALPSYFATILLETDLRAAFQAAQDYETKFNAAALSDSTRQKLQEAYQNSAFTAHHREIAKLLIKSAFVRSISLAQDEAQALNLSHEELLPIFKDGTGIMSSNSQDRQILLDWMFESANSADDFESISASALAHLEQWANTNFETAAHWLSQQSPSPALDSAIEGFSNIVAKIDGEAATLWAAKIQDAEKRGRTLQRTINHWQRQNPEAADAWELSNPQ